MLMLEIHDVRRGPPPFSFSELVRFSRPGRLDCVFAVLFACCAGVGVLGTAFVVSFCGSESAGGVTGPGKYEVRPSGAD